MKSVYHRIVILLACLICSGCGSAFYTHKIDVTVAPEKAGVDMTGFKLGLSNGVELKKDIAELQSVDSNGVVHFNHRQLQVLWAWQERPPDLSFGLFIPSVSTNGYFWFRFEETSWLPWRGLKRGKVKAYSHYSTFAGPSGWRRVPAISAEVAPSTLGGYNIKLNLPIKTLRDGVTSEFVPYKR